MTAAPPETAELLALKSRLDNANPRYYGGSTRIDILPEDYGALLALVEAAIAGKSADEVRQAVEHIEMAQSRLRAAMMGDEPCKPCIDLAASYLQEATAALSNTGEPKRSENREVAHEDCLNCRCPPDERCKP